MRRESLNTLIRALLAVLDAQRAALWSSVGETIDALREMEAAANSLKSAEQARQTQAFMQAAQSGALFALGGLQQMRVTVSPPRLGGCVAAGASGAIDQSITEVNSLMGAKTKRASDRAARRLSRSVLETDGILAEMQGSYGGTLKAALGGERAKVDNLLAQLQAAASRLP